MPGPNFSPFGAFLTILLTVMDLGCANRVNVRKSRTQRILRTRFSVANFGGLKSRRVRKIAYAKSRRVRKIESSWARFTYATRFCVRDFCWDFTECDLRTLGATQIFEHCYFFEPN